MARLRVLVVDDEKNIRSSLSVCLEDLGCTVRACDGAEAALAAVAEAAFDVAFVGFRLGDESDVDLLPRLSAAQPSLALVVVTDDGTFDTAVEAVRRGAADYLPKPLSPPQIEHVLDGLTSQRALRRRVGEIEAELRRAVPEIDLDSDTPEMRDAIDTVRLAAAVDAPVLLRGEHGTGKGVLARYLHSESPRQAMPFVAVGCAASPEDLLEREIFGYARGAFADAVRDQAGCIEAADGGTLFLEEIGALTPALQAKLLRLLEGRQFERVGESRTRYADVRVVAGTHRDLDAEVGERHFRRDLLYRLGVIDVHVPPLRQRVEDILPLARRFVAFFASALGYAPPAIASDAEAALLAHPWPGNVRELRNVVEHALLLAPGGTITAAALPRRFADGETGDRVYLGGDVTLDDIEREHVQRVLARHPKADDAARVLGIDPSTLWRKRKRWET